MNILIVLLMLLGASLESKLLEYPEGDYFLFNHHWFIQFERDQIVHDPDCPCQEKMVGFARKRSDDFWYLQMQKEE